MDGGSGIGGGTVETARYQAYTLRDLDRLPELARLPADFRFGMRVVAHVLPFRVNRYVLDELIDWAKAPDDPVFRLVFPHPDMLQGDDFATMAALVRGAAPPERLRAAAREIRMRLNPHPAEQRTLNVPRLEGRPLEGLQHKYHETVLVFPRQGQTCHAYCTFCFRWPQFVGEPDLRIAVREAADLFAYLRAHPEVTDVLATGGDPMVMRTASLARYLEPLARPEFDHLDSVRIGTKALTYWPRRFVSDPDADDLLRLLERLVRAGRRVAVMAHFNHWRELETEACRQAARRIQETGAVIRTQAPLLMPINADPAVWVRLWRTQVRLGMVPYYMFVARDTGARHYFEVPLARAWQIFRDAFAHVSGLSRTVRGPSMSAGPGKVEVQGVARVKGEEVFVLRFLQGRDPAWVERPFFARFDPAATWLDQLEPAFGADRFFYEEAYAAMGGRC